MKLWRKQAMKEGKQNGKRPGRQIRYANAMQEMIFKRMPRTYPLLNKMFVHAGVIVPAAKPVPVTETTNEAQ